MTMPKKKFDKLRQMSGDIIRMLNDADDHPAFAMTVLTYVNAGFLFSVLGGANPTEILEGLQERIEEAYADICAAGEEIADD